MEVLKLPLSIVRLLKVLGCATSTHLPWGKSAKGLKAETYLIFTCLAVLASQARCRYAAAPSFT